MLQFVIENLSSIDVTAMFFIFEKKYNMHVDVCGWCAKNAFRVNLSSCSADSCQISCGVFVFLLIDTSTIFLHFLVLNIFEACNILRHTHDVTLVRSFQACICSSV